MGPRQLTEGRVHLGLGFKRVRVHDHGKAWQQVPEAESSHLGSQTQGREGELEMAPDFETSKPALSDTLL